MKARTCNPSHIGIRGQPMNLRRWQLTSRSSCSFSPANWSTLKEWYAVGTQFWHWAIHKKVTNVWIINGKYICCSVRQLQVFIPPSFIMDRLLAARKLKLFVKMIFTLLFLGSSLDTMSWCTPPVSAIYRIKGWRAFLFQTLLTGAPCSSFFYSTICRCSISFPWYHAREWQFIQRLIFSFIFLNFHVTNLQEFLNKITKYWWVMSWLPCVRACDW